MKVTSDWQGLNVDLSKLTEHVESFFKSKGLYAKRILCEGGFKIFVSQNGKSRDICAEILGDSRNFQVNFVLDDRSGSASMLGSVFSVFFGGGLLLKTLKSKELFEKIEPEFWIYIDKVIEELNAVKDR
jgi:hypothetical protein